LEEQIAYIDRDDYYLVDIGRIVAILSHMAEPAPMPLVAA
jgi:hypothetical protein